MTTLGFSHSYLHKYMTTTYIFLRDSDGPLLQLQRKNPPFMGPRWFALRPKPLEWANWVSIANLKMIEVIAGTPKPGEGFT